MFDLRERLGYLTRIESPERRGREFEELLSKLFEGDGFDVHRNAAGASPRQTDLMVSRGEYTLLVEAKCHRRKLDISHIDDITSRLRRTPSDVVGAIFSLSGFTRSAIRLAEGDRSREVLLFGPQDLAAIVEGRANFLHLIGKKREELRLHATAWFYTPHGTSPVSRPSEGTDSINMEGTRLKYVACASGNSDVVFAREIPDTAWGGYGGLGVALPLDLQEIETPADLRAILSVLGKRFTISGNGAFAIHQLKASWFGIGPRALLDGLNVWKERYEAVGLDTPHHSEHFAYFDRLNDGWIVLTGRQRIDWDRPSRLDSCEIVIRLPGAPVDGTPFVRFCREVNNPDARFFPVGGQRLHDAYDAHMVRLPEPIRLEVLGTITQRHKRTGDAVCGVVARNPLFGATVLPPELTANDSSPFRLLDSTELLVCDLADWLDIGTVVDGYELIRLEGLWADDQAIIKPVATWGKILTRNGKPEDPTRILSALPNSAALSRSSRTKARRRSGK